MNLRNSLLAFLLLFWQTLQGQSITAGGPTTFCAGASVQLSVTGVTGTVTYQWTQNGTNIPNETNSTLLVTTSGTYTCVVTQNGTPTTINPGIQVTVNPLPGTELGGPNPSTYNGEPYFTICNSSPPSQLTFTNQTTSSNSNYQIVWGNGNPNFSGQNFTVLTQTYGAGTFPLDFTVTGTNGCQNTKRYYVFVGSNPAVGLTNPGNTNICSGGSLTFPISGADLNPPSTTYTMTFNDASPPVVLNHPPPASYTHTFINTSCGTNSPGYNNSFYAQIKASNPCFTSTSTIVPIYVSEKPQASFTISPKDTVCTNRVVTFTENGKTGNTISNGVCSPGKRVWSISPATGWSLGSGTLGNTFSLTDPGQWLAGSASIQVTFTTPGVYDITLQVGANTLCGNSTITKRICVNPEPVANFSVNPDIGCAPLNVAVTNTSNAMNCGTPTYQWTVTYTPITGCSPNTSNFSYTNNTNASSFAPSFVFNNPGTYSIALRVIAPANACSSAVVTKQITVKGKPFVTLTSPTSACLGNSINPSVTATCYTTGANYNWAFSNATPATANTQNPGSVVFTSGGTNTISVSVSNECGSTTATNNINTLPLNTAAAPSPRTLCINTALSPTITIATTGATGIGAASGLPTGVTANWSSNTITISGTPTQAGTFNYTIPLTGGCGTVNATGTIIVVPNNTATSTSPRSLCINTALSPDITITTTGATGIGTPLNLPPGVTANWSSNTITISGTPTATGTFNYTIPLTGGCGTVNASGIITVVASNTATAPPPRITCLNVALSPTITITTGGATGIGTPSGLPTGVTANWSSNIITISGTPTAAGTFNYSIPLTGGCGTVSATGTITVNASNTAATPSASPSLCINTPLTPVTIATTGATGIGTATGLPTGITANWNNNTITISGTPTQAGTFNYTIPLTGGCGTVSATGTITVLVNTVTNASSNPSLCINTTLSPAITFTTTGATGVGTPVNLPPGLTATWSSNTITISGTPTTAGTFNYTIPLTGGCGTVNATGTISVVAGNTAAAPPPRTACVNIALSPNISITTGGATGIGTPSGLPAGLNATWNSNTITISGTPTATGNFNYSIPLTGGCGTVNATGTITINPVNTAAVPSANPTVCINVPLSPTITIATTGATGIGISTGLPNGVAATWSSNTITISGTPTQPGTFNYTIPLTGGCGTVSATGTITVLINTVTTASANPSLCVNTALSPDITFTTTGATGVGTPVNLPPGLTANWNNNTITISGTPTATGTFNYTIPLTGGCGTVNATGTISVVASNTAGAPSANPTLCINTALSPNITIATTGATGIGTVAGLPAGVTATWNNNTITLSGTPTVTGTYNYTIPLTGGCGSINAIGTITVTAANTTALPSANPTLCINTSITPVTIATTGATGIGTAIGLPTGVTATWNNNTITISGTPSIAGTFNYTIPLTGGCGNITASGNITVLVNTATTPAPRSICVNEGLTPDITITTTGATGIGNVTGLPGGLNAVWNNNTITISGTPTTIGTFNYSIPLAGGCGNILAAGTISVIAGNTAAAPAPRTLCINTALSPNISIATTGATGIGSVAGLPTGVTATWSNNTITISGTPTATGTFNYTIPLTGGCGTVNAIGLLTVTPDNTTSAASANPTVCINTFLSPAITFTTTGATGIGTVTGLPAGLTASWNNNTITISGTPTVSGTFNYSIPLTGGCGSINATGTVTVTPNNTAAALAPRTICINTPLSPDISIVTTGATGIGAVAGLPPGLTASWNNNTLTISGTPSVAGTYNYIIPLTGGCGTISATGTIQVTAANTLGPPSANPTLCINSPLTPITFPTTGSTGIATPVGLPTGVTASWNNNTITISGTPSVAGTFSYSIPLTGGCGTLTATGTITVLTNTVSVASANPTLCINSPLVASIAFTTTGATGIGTPSGLPTGVIATWNNNTITISGTPTVAGIFNYSIPLTGGCGMVTATGLIDVKPRPIVQPATVTTCSGQAFTVSPTNGNGNVIPGGTTYSWPAPVTTGGMAGTSGTGPALTDNLINGTVSPQTATYTVTPSAGTCSGADFAVVVTVNPTPTISFSRPDQTLCSGSSSQPVTISSTTAGASIAWTSNFPAGLTAVPSTTSGTTLIPSYVFTNSTTTPITVSFVAAVSTSGTPACPGLGGTYTITVIPTPPPPVSLPRVEYCQNEPPVALSAVATGNNVLNWYLPPNHQPPGTPTAPTPSTATVGTTIYFVSQISPTTPACESPRTRIEVVVKPIPQISVSAVAPTTCNSINGVMTISGLFPNAPYQVYYTANNVPRGPDTFIANAAGNVVVDNLVGGIYKDVYVILNGCRSNMVAGPFSLLNPGVPATPDASSNSPLCEGATLQLNALSLTPNVTYEWSGPRAYTSTLQNPQIVTASVANTGRYYVIAKNNGCQSFADSVDVVIHPNPTVDLGADPPPFLPPASRQLTPIITNGPISQYTWTPSVNLSCTNCLNPVAQIYSSITYRLTVRNNNGCTASDEIRFITLCERSVVYIPNAFVPGAGGPNAVFKIKSVGPLTVKHFRLFNRWGELIFERTNFPTNDNAYGWDGRVNGVLVNPDVFVYTAEVLCENGSTIFFKGNVTLLR